MSGPATVTRLIDRDEAALALAGTRGAIVTGHVQADGDCLGSELALWHYLRSRGAAAEVWNDGEVPPRYAFLPGADRVREARAGFKPDPASGPWDLVVVVDTPVPPRLGAAAAWLDAGLPVLLIDHHPGPGFGERALIETGCSSIGELLYRLFERIGWPVSKEAAACLYTAIITDTGRFSFSNTSADTHRAVAGLLSTGMDPRGVIREVYESRSLEALRLLGRVFSGLGEVHGGRVLWAAMSRADLAEVGGDPEIARDLVQLMRTVRGVALSLMFRETEVPGRIKVAFRSDGSIDANRLAARFGGGGHPAASGATMQGGLEAVTKAVLDEVKANLDLYPTSGPVSPELES